MDELKLFVLNVFFLFDIIIDRNFNLSYFCSGCVYLLLLTAYFSHFHVTLKIFLRHYLTKKHI